MLSFCSAVTQGQETVVCPRQLLLTQVTLLEQSGAEIVQSKPKLREKGYIYLTCQGLLTSIKMLCTEMYN